MPAEDRPARARRIRSRQLDALTRPVERLLAGALVLIVAGTYVAVRYAHDLLPGDTDPRGHMLQIAAGVIVVLGAYFTAIGLTFNRAQRRIELLGKTVEQLANKDEATRISAVWVLEAIAYDAPLNHGEALMTGSLHRAIWWALATAKPPVSDELGDARLEVQRTLRWLDPKHFPDPDAQAD
jgi:hypothetical protein